MQARNSSFSKRFIRLWLITTLLSLVSIQHAFGEDLNVFLKTYCIECHGEAKQKGDRRFDQLSLSKDDPDSLLDLQDILDQLTLGEMPPKKSKKPTEVEKKKTMELLTEAKLAKSWRYATRPRILRELLFAKFARCHATRNFFVYSQFGR